MGTTTRWKNKRKTQFFLTISESFSDALYSLSVLKSIEDDAFSLELYETSEDEIRRNLTAAIQTLERLEEAASGDATTRVAHFQFIEETEVTAAELQTIQTALRESRDELTRLDTHSDAYDTLRSLQQTAREAARHYTNR